MPDQILAPIMIGITGKRMLHDKDEAVRRAIDACFDLLDRHLAASSKLLLTGLASGADTIAAQSALDRGWKVIAVLPFELELYTQDFDTAGAQRLRTFADENSGLLADPANGRVIVLDPLIDPQTKKPFPVTRLSHRAEGSNPDRTNHYEQVGLFIADCAALMIAVMPAAEQPDRIGGTARIVRYRLHDTHDLASATIRQHSQVLHKSTELDAPQAAPLWLIDLESVDDKSDNALNPVQVWQPGREIPDVKIVKWKSETDLIRGLKLACRINAFNELAASVENEQAQKSFESKKRTDAQWKKEFDEHKHPGFGDATSSLRKIRSMLSIIQGHKKQKLTYAIDALSVLFVCAVVLIELHILSENIYTIAVYSVLLAAIAVVFSRAKSKTLQQFSEDYRAVAEALRVQIVWWDAGLTKPEHRVNRTYLCGAAGSLALVRAAIRHLVDAAFLEKPAPQSAQDKDKGRAQEWVSEQIEYFRKRTNQRRKLLTHIEHAIWFLFIASMGMAFALIPLALMLVENNWLNPIVARIDDRLIQPGELWWHAALVAAFAAAAMFIGGLGIDRLSRAHSDRERRRMFEILNNALAFVAGIVLTIGIYAFVAGANPFDGRFIHLVTHHMSACSVKIPDDPFRCSHNLAHNLAIAVMIIMASGAGALRFYSERRGLEAELHSYREALEVFRRANNKLFPKNGAITIAQPDDILLELGMHALKENESWIRAHRVRPLEPHV